MAPLVLDERVRKGDRYVYGDDSKPYFIEVTRVARDQSWADIRVCNWAVMWTKRQPLPVPGRREDWTWIDVLSFAPESEAA